MYFYHSRYCPNKKYKLITNIQHARAVPFKNQNKQKNSCTVVPVMGLVGNWKEGLVPLSCWLLPYSLRSNFTFLWTKKTEYFSKLLNNFPCKKTYWSTLNISYGVTYLHNYHIDYSVRPLVAWIFYMWNNTSVSPPVPVSPPPWYEVGACRHLALMSWGFLEKKQKTRVYHLSVSLKHWNYHVF